MQINQEYEEVRLAAEEAKQKVLEDYFRPLVTKAFNDLCAWLPKRKISLTWGMGVYSLNVESKGTYSATTIFDCYGGVNDAEFMRETMKGSFLKTPLYLLVELLDECHCMDGVALHLEDLKSE